MVGTITLLLAATKSVAAAVLLFAWAGALAWKGVVDQPFISKIAHLSKTMYLPCLVFSSVASGMSMPFIRENWSLVLVGFLVIGIGFVVGRGLVALLHLPDALRPWFILAVAMPNMVALPLVLVEAICHEQEASASNIAVCIDGYTTRLFTVTLMHTFIFWTLGPCYVRSSAKSPSGSEVPSRRRGGGRGPAAERAGLKDAADAEAAVEEPAAEEAVERDCQAACSAGCGSEPVELESQAEGAAPPPGTLGRAADGFSATSTPLPNGDFGDSSPSKSKEREASCCAGACRGCWEFLLDNPPVVANLAAIFVAAWPPLHQLFYAPAAPLSFLASSSSLVGKASPAVTNIVTGGCFGLQLRQLKRDDPLGLRALGISRMAMALLVIGRIVMAPLLNLLLLLLLLPIIPEDPWSRLTLVFQPAGVTANVVTVLAQVSGQPQGAQLVALAAIPQMMLYIPVSTALIALGMAWNEG